MIRAAFIASLRFVETTAAAVSESAGIVRRMAEARVAEERKAKRMWSEAGREMERLIEAP